MPPRERGSSATGTVPISAVFREMPVVRLFAFARLRELLGERRDVAVADGATVGDLWEALVREEPRLTEFARGTRFARNDRLCSAEVPVRDGDEIALLPPFGGG